MHSIALDSQTYSYLINAWVPDGPEESNNRINLTRIRRVGFLAQVVARAGYANRSPLCSGK